MSMTEFDVLSVLLGIIGGLIVFLASVFAWWASRITAKLDALMSWQQDALGRFADAAKNRQAHQRLWDALEHLRSGRRSKLPRPPYEEE